VAAQPGAELTGGYPVIQLLQRNNHATQSGSRSRSRSLLPLAAGSICAKMVSVAPERVVQE
jgi:hypothetical protein